MPELAQEDRELVEAAMKATDGSYAPYSHFHVGAAIRMEDCVPAPGTVEETLERGRLRAAQTPQVFEASLLKAALQSALEQGAPVTDDASAVERLGKTVFLVDGGEENLKITTPLDLAVAEAILQGREGAR